MDIQVFHCMHEIYNNKCIIFSYILDVPLHCLASWEVKFANLLQIWKKMQTKCIDITSIHFNASRLLTH